MNLGAIEVVVVLAWGAVLGLFFFGGLWWTLSRLPRAPRPMVWMVGSFLGRTVGMAAGLTLVMGGQWQRLVVTLVGVFAMRWVLVRWLGGGGTVGGGPWT